MRARSALLALVVVAGLVSAPAGAAYPGCDPTSPPSLASTSTLPGADGAEGKIGYPSGAPTALVVYFHGYGNDSDAWVCHILEATTHGAIAFALDYRGTGQPPLHRGWFVKEGAEDSVRLAKALLESYPGLPVVAFGISMGGNAAGLAVAAAATKPTGEPLFDHWVNVEAVSNLAEEYLLASIAARASDYAARAVQDIETECGGTLTEQPECYRELTLVARGDDFVASGIESVHLVHGVDDGTVPHDQSRQFVAMLRARGIATDFYSVGRRNDWQNAGSAPTEAGTTITGTLLSSATGGAYPAPLAGHGWEGSNTHIVIRTGFDILWRLLDGDLTGSADREFVVDSELGTTQIR